MFESDLGLSSLVLARVRQGSGHGFGNHFRTGEPSASVGTGSGGVSDSNPVFESVLSISISKCRMPAHIVCNVADGCLACSQWVFNLVAWVVRCHIASVHRCTATLSWMSVHLPTHPLRSANLPWVDFEVVPGYEGGS